MLVEYFNNTIEQSFLKALLSAVQLPEFKIVKDSDLIFEGYFYIYDRKIIKCTKTGYILPIDRTTQEYIIGQNIGLSSAEYEIILDHYRFSQMDQNIEFKEFIRASYYSTELHKRFGEFLRVIRDLYDIDLMGMYNCFSYEVFNDVYVGWTGERYNMIYGTDNTKKVLAVPIRFNTKYTVGIRSSQNVIITPILKLPTGKKPLMIYDTENSQKEYIPIVKSGSLFEQPFTFSIDITEYDDEAFKYEKFLYAIIQVSDKNQSSLAVLEGDFTRNTPYFISACSNDANEIGYERVALMYKPKLLQFNDGTSYAYSNTVIQYLLHNVITSEDVTEGNISYVKDLLGWSDDINYWNDFLKYSAYMKYLTKDGTINENCEDVTGFIDKQVEEFLNYG